MREPVAVEQLQNIELHAGFGFTKGCPVLQIPTGARAAATPSLLYDMEADSSQTKPIKNAEIEAQMCAHLTRLMRECEAPPQQFERLGLAR